MNNHLEQLKKSFITNEKKLKYAAQVLKQEFKGIDPIIDKIIAHVSTWFNLNSIQETPMIVNLWGMTGVGKTALLQRLFELIEYSDKYYRIDLGNKENSVSFNSVTTDIKNLSENIPVVFSLDEFQHTRTIDGNAMEIHKDSNRRVWDLIDSGKISYKEYDHHLIHLIQLYENLNLLTHKGVIVKNGIIVSGIKLFKKEFEINDEDTDLRFIQPEFYGNIKSTLYESAPKLIEDIEEELMSMDAQQSLQYLKKAISKGGRFKSKNFSKALIFVLGNLDEAFSIAGEFNQDLDADYFHEKSLKISVPQIKESLKKRFRKEQIARLGNIHIIYPSLSKNTYKNIISTKVDEIAKQLKEKTGVKLVVNQHLLDLIYTEGVIPTQGIRPLLTSINYYIKNTFSSAINYALLNNYQFNLIKLNGLNRMIDVAYYQEDALVNTYLLPIETPISDLKNNINEDQILITAVHESGHALVHIFMKNEFPETILCNSSSANSLGFMLSKPQERLVSFQDIKDKIATCFGGMLAEEIIFGKNNITLGNHLDIQMASKHITKLLKHNAFLNDYPIQFDFGNPFAIDNAEKIEKIAIEMAVEMKQKARKILEREKKLLLVLSEILIEQKQLKSNDIKAIYERFAIEKKPLTQFSYLNAFNQEIQNLNNQFSNTDKNFIISYKNGRNNRFINLMKNASKKISKELEKYN